jgi:hypothetical protein
LLNYKLTDYTALYCLEYLLNYGVVWDIENFDGDLYEFNSLCYRILDFFIEDVRFIDFNPLQISCAVIRLARDNYRLKDSWNGLFTQVYDINKDYFMNCFIVIKR